MEIFVQQLVNGLVIGLMYALIALGYTMVYGIIRLINFAHGDIFMSGAFIGYFTFVLLGFYSAHFGYLDIFLVFVVAMLVAGLLGVTVERLAYRPLRQSPKIVVLISSIGVSFTLEYLVRVFVGPAFLSYPSNFGRQTVSLGLLHVTYIQIAIILICSLFMLGITMFVKNTLTGKAMRAIAVDQDTSRLMGINVDKVIAMTFFIGASIAGAGGVMFGIYYGEINFLMGFLLGLKAFTSSIIGGIGNIPGAFVGGIVLGLLETFGSFYLGGQWKDVFSFIILIAVLLFKPTGLLGEKVAERM